MATRGRKRKVEEVVSHEVNSIEPQLKKVKMEAESKADLEVVVEQEEIPSAILAPEIVISIFERLSDQDRTIAATVCRDWLTISHDPLFSWVPCFSLDSIFQWSGK